MSPGFHSVLLHLHIPPSKKLGTFHKTHFQQEVASSRSSEGNDKTKSKSSHFIFCIFDDITTISEKVNLNILSCYLNYFFTAP
ncbi:hypothetical protein PO909_017556 [Leuciscus waleckii]